MEVQWAAIVVHIEIQGKPTTKREKYVFIETDPGGSGGKKILGERCFRIISLYSFFVLCQPSSLFKQKTIKNLEVPFVVLVLCKSIVSRNST